MKLTILAALGAAAVCAALFMGKDDIRRFIRMRNMLQPHADGGASFASVR